MDQNLFSVKFNTSFWMFIFCIANVIIASDDEPVANVSPLTKKVSSSVADNEASVANVSSMTRKYRQCVAKDEKSAAKEWPRKALEGP